jgi:hypothetical protein
MEIGQCSHYNTTITGGYREIDEKLRTFMETMGKIVMAQ